MRLGVLRAYATRHGAGPFVTEDPALAARLTEPHNGTNAWQERFRCGHLDLVATRYALEVAGGVDALVVTHLDTLRTFDRARAAVAYRPALDLDPTLVAGVADVCRGAITRLRPCWERNLAYQEQLTALAARSAPCTSTSGAEPRMRRFSPSWKGRCMRLSSSRRTAQTLTTGAGAPPSAACCVDTWRRCPRQ